MKFCKVVTWLDNIKKYYTMKNIFHKKGWATDTKLSHIEPPLIPFIKKTYTGNSDGDEVKLKLHWDPTSITSDIYEFWMFFFDHGEPEEFILFVQNFQMTLVATGTLETKAKFQYLCTLIYREALCQFD